MIDGVPAYTVTSWVEYRPLGAFPLEGKRVRRVARPGGYRQSARFTCQMCGMAIWKRDVVRHIKPAREGELSECKLAQRRGHTEP